MGIEPKEIIVEPERLRSGLWGYEEGDISRSYSGDVYGMGKKIRKPFTHAAQLYVSMGIASGGSRDQPTAKSYPLVPESYHDSIMEEFAKSGLYSGYTGDPCIGSGGMVLALAEEFAMQAGYYGVDLIRLTGKDISKVGCDMAYFNTTSFGIPACIEWGDTLRATTEKIWYNPHWDRVVEQDRRKSQTEKMLKAMKALITGDLGGEEAGFEPKSVEQSEAVPVEEKGPSVKVEGDQMSWDFL